MEALKESLEALDFGALMPELDTILGWVEVILRLCVMAGPLLLLGFGLVFLLIPPKEANYGLGYRFWWGMASMESWQFTQRIAGMAWSLLGAVLTIVMALKAAALRDFEPTVMVQQAGLYLLWQLGLTVLACIAVDVIVIVFYDSKGYRRKKTEK